jgi:peptidyl-tRNA hydrolase, PTH1 family
MNNSGLAIKKIFKSQAFVSLIIVHDDIDLALGTYKLSINRGSAGHKGVESIIRELGTEDFTRIRIGVSKETKPDVLEKFSKEDKKILEEVFNQVLEEINKLIKK